MRKRVISMILCLALVFQTGSLARSEEAVLLEEAEAFLENWKIDEAAALEQEEIGTETMTKDGEAEAGMEREDEELILDEGEFEDDSPEAAGSAVSEETVWEEDGVLWETEIPEETEAKLLEEESEGLIEEEIQFVTVTETVSLKDPGTVPANASEGSSRMRSITRYDGCYGNQLSGAALEFYNQRVSYFVTERETGQLLLEYDVNSSPITFSADLYKDSNEKWVIDKSTEEYEEFKAQVSYALQASLDAFLYDYPELFWARVREAGFTYTIGAVGSSSKGWTGYVKAIPLEFNESFSGAKSLISDYDAAVKETVKEISETADLNQDGTISTTELVLNAHDYLCERLYYDTDAYNNYASTKDYRIFSSAGAFLDSVGTGVVCEGYAKALKVLCDQLGIPCVLIGGTVTQNGKTEGHMWNGVQINGTWYLMDVTWDDGSSGYSYKYCMVGNITENRTSSGNFGGSQNPFIFTYPELSADSMDFCVYGAYNKQETLISPSCTEQGKMKYTCTRCSSSYEQAVNSLGHDAKTTQVIAPTCTEGGYAIHMCSRCKTGYTDSETPALGHDYVSKVTAPTCTEGGYTIHMCSRCKTEYTDSETPALGHDYMSKVTAPTCQAQGCTTHTCSRCQTAYKDQITAKAAHSYRNGTCIWCKTGDSIVNASISKLSSYGYDPKGVKPELTVAFGTKVLKEGTDYTVTYRNNTALGTGYVTVTGTGNYRGTVSRSFKIIRRVAAKLTFSSIADQTYTGKAKKPALTIYNNGTKLKKNRDYTITYSKNKNVGQAVITVKLKGNYTGTKKLYFNILPKTPVLSKVKSAAKGKMTVSWKKASGAGGYQIQYSLKSSFEGAKTVSATGTSKTISKLSKGKVYYVRIRSYKKVNGKKYYSSWSKTKKATIKK